MSSVKPQFTLQNAPEVIPVFPLPGALLLPRGRLPLNIFEPRYLAMIDDALKTEHRLIGMIQPRCCETSKTGRELYKIGCAGRIVTFSETDDGRYIIALTGVSRFQVDSEIEGFQPYRRVSAHWDNFEMDAKKPQQDDPDFNKDEFLELVNAYFRAKSLDTDWEALGQADEETIVNALSMMCPFAAGEKQALLEAEDLQARRETLAALLRIDAAGDDSQGRLQ